MQLQWETEEQHDRYSDEAGKCKRKWKVQFVTSKGLWYREAAKANPGLRARKYERFGKRSLVESAIKIVKHRLRRFDRRRL